MFIVPLLVSDAYHVNFKTTLALDGFPALTGQSLTEWSSWWHILSQCKEKGHSIHIDAE
jgi:hypothetical protein